LSQNEVARLYRQSDIMVDLSYWHGFGRTGLEAMACGVVPVLSPSGGVDRYAVDGQNCYLIDATQVQSVAERIIYLAKERTKRLALREAAMVTAKQFGEGNAVDDWQSLWTNRNSTEVGQDS
jgi:glycosyltransferase involved in cell wall biosynthesis